MIRPKPRIIDGVEHPVAWEAHPGPQTRFLTSAADEVLYGGQAGGGKTGGLLAAACRNLHHPHYTGIIFRRTYVELQKHLVEAARFFVPACVPGAKYGDHTWRAPSGGRLIFSHMQHVKDRFKHQSAEYQFIGFEELTQFEEIQYTYLLSRLRGTHGLPNFVRATTNPGGPGHEWVKRRWAPWLDSNSETRGTDGEPLYYVNTRGGPVWVKRGTPKAFARTFIRARRSDNPSLDGTGYDETLMGLPAVERAQLMDGDWDIRPASGDYFKREWVIGLKGEKYIDEAPADTRWIRYWDRASTEASEKSPDPDWTVGVKLGLADDMIIIGHVIRKRLRPAGVEKLILQTAETDGREVEIGIEQDPGQAGVAEAAAYLRLLRAFVVRAHPVSQKKLTRFKPFSAQAEAGNVRIVRGQWNEDYLSELEAFDDPNWHDDQVDATSGAYNALAGEPITVAQNWANADPSSWLEDDDPLNDVDLDPRFNGF